MSTDIFCWNVRGLNKYNHRSGFRKWFRNNNPFFGGLLETHVKQHKINKFISELLPGWLFDDNYFFSPLGRIWILWHPSLTVTVVQKSSQMISAEVVWPSSPETVTISIVYASNDVLEREALWNEISALAGSRGLLNKPWILIGDLNQIRNPAEHSNPPSLNVDKRMRDLNQCLQDVNLDDLNFRGTTYTWWNKRKSAPVAKKLDRALVNDDWYFHFPESVANFGSPAFSDHSVITVTIDPSRVKAVKAFKFYNFLTLNLGFLDLIASNWYSFNTVGSAMFRVSSKLKLLKNAIRSFSKSNYSELEKRTAEAHESLVQAQEMTLNSPSPLNASLELSAQNKWEELSKAEQEFFLQRSRIQWSGLGDNNTRFFHRYAKSRQSKNHIHYLFTESGERIDSQSGILDLCVQDFSHLLGSPLPPAQFVQSDLNLLFDFRCSPAQTALFSKGLSHAEIKDAFFSLPRNKTCGPDGYSAEFFTASWQVIGPEVTDAILEFFKSGQLLKQWNATTLVLIPKKPNASVTADFRPISCLNTLYKVATKLLAKRLKDILPQVISKAQSAFLPGRLLAENVLLATDLVNGYNTAASTPRGMLKVDLRKAFDSVRWDFILATLLAIGIPQPFIDLIAQCLSTASFSVSVNGSVGGFFKSSKGIRQGDPLSPYLFVLAMECFTRLLNSRYISGSIRFHPRTQELGISHLMFADDVMIFFDGTSDSLHGIAECLDDFASWSGLQMNPQKTEIFTSGLSQAESVAVASYGFPSGAFPIRYLGLPLKNNKLKVAEYTPLLTKISSQLQSWSVKMLSFSGRLQLLKSVIFGTVNFWISAFILPKGCLRSMEALCARFLWAGNIEKRGIAKVAWNNVCLPKKEGGLGLRSFVSWNLVLCLRFIWILQSRKDSLWANWHWEYSLKNDIFWEIKAGPQDSWTWKNLLKLRPLALIFCKSFINNGKDTSFWLDPWSPFGQLINYIGADGPRRLRLPRNAMVADAIDSNQWRLPHPRSNEELDLHAHLTTIVLPLPSDTVDIVAWIVDNYRMEEFSSGRLWNVLRPRQNEQPWADIVWYKGAVPKHAFNMWVANLDRLPTRARLLSWGMNINPLCPFCSREVETRDHLLLACEYSNDVWYYVFQRCGAPGTLIISWPELLSWIRNAATGPLAILRRMATQATIYHLWKQRNNLIHNQISLSPHVVFQGLEREVRNGISAKRHLKKFSSLMVLWLR
ncbi:hypothetical protein YC2023_005495 [Brassica napus]